MKLKLDHVYFDHYKNKLFKVVYIDKTNTNYPMKVIYQDGTKDGFSDQYLVSDITCFGIGKMTNYPEYYL